MPDRAPVQRHPGGGPEGLAGGRLELALARRRTRNAAPGRRAGQAVAGRGGHAADAVPGRVRVVVGGGDDGVGARSRGGCGGGGGNELDAYVAYDFGPFALTVTNYTFPDGDGTYSSGGFFEGDLEISASTEIGGLSLMGGYFPDLETLYIEAGFAIGAVDLAVGFGSDSADAFYVGDGESAICNVSFGYSKEIKITDDYSLPLFSSFVFNPSSEAAFIVFGMSF